MALSQQERTLRLITIGSWVPGMALLIPYGVKSQMAFPPLGLIPLTMSAIVGLAKVYSSAGYIQYTVFMDALIAILLLCFIIPGFPMRWPELGTFAVCPLFVNITLHTLFVLRDSGVLTSLEDLLRPRTCQYCHRDLKAMWDAKVENQNALKADNSISPPVQQTTDAQPSASATAPAPAPAPRPASASPSNFTTPRPSTDYDAETLHSVDATIRSQSPFKGRRSGDMV